MEPLTFKEFIRFIFSKSSIKRLYSRQLSKRDVIKQISDKFTMTDDTYITKPNPKKFVGSFVPNTDNFTANLTQSIRRYSYTGPGMVEVNGSIRDENNRAQIFIDYRPTNELIGLIRVLCIINVVLFLILILKVRDLFSALVLCFFIIFMTGGILTTLYSLIQRQIRYTESFLIFDNGKNAGNTIG